MSDKTKTLEIIIVTNTYYSIIRMFWWNDMAGWQLALRTRSHVAILVYLNSNERGFRGRINIGAQISRISSSILSYEIIY